MALIAALLPNAADRDALGAAVDDHRMFWARDWRDLTRVVKREPAVAAIADLHAERGKDGVLRIYRFAQRYPRTPILVWGDLDGRDLFRLGKAGATDVVVPHDSGNPTLLSELILDATTDRVADRIDERLRGRIGERARRLVDSAARRIAEGIQVPDLAALHDMSVSTLERRCQDWGLTTPGRILLWLRIIYGLNWLLEPGRSVESVAGQLGYSSGAAFRRAIKVTVGGKPTPLRNEEGVEAALAGFLADCPARTGAPAGGGD
ncbi:MAG: helix-turn-helix domain-containing protein [Gemmatimonadetes bacterium]|nr:helix-turn-helix transcriptional regulator [Gemmatimonadota bacterium]NIQ53012.1 helix-turn-helix transcriptional regulator [Gemmatimonadota bacterium]NIU73156.1 helix-turn-helix domain-containing protein [Gammaproteobacteria bacterium]NIX43450.1 helix-turn-helix domain-containing protein [Gemmatimonadota bacterium]NIY07626.1 helix-turn-helix domain-containing protein [Gemmatimonadota bacterium]